MNYTIKITEVYSIPAYNGFKNMISKVRWEIEFERNNFTSLAVIETVLDTDNINNIENFTELEDLTKDQIVEWVLNKEGGDNFISMLKEIHSKALDDKEIASKAIRLDLPFVTTPVVQPINITYNIEQIDGGV